MNFFLGVGIGLAEIRAHKFRSFLTMLGIILGVASLLAMFALTAGIAKGMRENLQAVGGVEQVNVANKDVSAALQDLASLSPGRTLRDAETLAVQLGPELITDIAPESHYGNAAIQSGAQTVRALAVGTTPGYLAVNSHTIAAGRFFCDLDAESASRVAVIGAGVARQLWPGRARTDADLARLIGNRVLINGRPFTIIGMFPFYERDEDKRRREVAAANAASTPRPTPAPGAAGRPGARGGNTNTGGGGSRRDPFFWKNNVVAIPIATMFLEFKSAQYDEKTKLDQGPNWRLDKLAFRVADTGRFDEVVARAGDVLQATHRGIDDYTFETREDWFDRIESSVRATRLSGTLIAGISLLVGGIGITNIMLASISERVREIGIRRSIGARRRDVFIQILVESVVTAVLGGLLGLGVAFAIVQGLIVLAPADNAPVVEAGAVGIAFGFAVLVGILAGLYPAWKAASLDPIQALRYE